MSAIMNLFGTLMNQPIKTEAEAEALAKTKGFLMINLDVRATQTRAIQSFEARGFSRYAVNEHYARVDNAYVTGYYFQKELK